MHTPSRYRTRLALAAAFVTLSFPARVSDAQTVVSPAIDSGALPSFSVRSGDIVRLRIWREPDLSGDYPVDELGRVNLPLIGTYSVLGQSRESLRQKLTDAFRGAVQNLSMDVIFLRRIPVVGAVRTPGLYPMDPTMTVADALALAGGAVTDVSDTRIQLLRRGTLVVREVDPSTPISRLLTEPGDQIYVRRPNGFFDRNPWAAGTLIQSGVAAILAIITIRSR